MKVKELTNMEINKCLKKVSDSKTSIHPGWLCPLNMKPCNKKCLCFSEAWFLTGGELKGKKVGYFRPAECNNDMFKIHMGARSNSVGIKANINIPK